MKKVTIILSLLLGFIGFSQKPKTYYYDENQHGISKAEFDKRDAGWQTGFLKGYFSDLKNANTEAAMIFRALEKGVISREAHKEAIDYINKITNAGIDEEYTIVICYFFKPVNRGEGIIDHQSSQGSYTSFFHGKKRKVFNIFYDRKRISK